MVFSEIGDFRFMNSRIRLGVPENKKHAGILGLNIGSMSSMCIVVMDAKTYLDRKNIYKIDIVLSNANYEYLSPNWNDVIPAGAWKLVHEKETGKRIRVQTKYLANLLFGKAIYRPW